jgi:hypothetical protein
MHRLSLLLLAVAACGGTPAKTETPATGGAPAPAPGEEAKVAGPPEVAWKDMSHDQRAKFMDAVVMPKMKPMFQAFDAKQFHEFNCKTCHGEGAKNHTFKMPNPDIFVLPGTSAEFQALAQTKGEWMKFMSAQVKPEMAKLLGEPEWEPEHPDPNAFKCFNCHTHKEEPKK